jgi:hypothetical protein
MDGSYCHCHVLTKCNENSIPVGSLHKLVVMAISTTKYDFYAAFVPFSVIDAFAIFLTHSAPSENASHFPPPHTFELVYVSLFLK